MYVTRPLSLYKKFPASLSLPPPEGPNSGYLVIQDQDEESEYTNRFGKRGKRGILELPIPQNKNLIVSDPDSQDYVIFIPVLNKPLSSNRYYVMQARGRHTGEAYRNSKEEDFNTRFCCNVIHDAKPMPLNSHNLYQQFEICHYKRRGYFVAKSVAPGGFPPLFLRGSWSIDIKLTSKNYELGEALGLDTALRARLPEFNFPLSYKTSEIIVVGKWYCPFMFIKEERTLKDQIKISMYYEMTLEQRWEQIFVCENNSTSSIGNAVAVDVIIQKEAVTVAGKEVVHDARKVVNRVKWFRSASGIGGEVSVGLSLEVVERMKWEQERAGWVDEEDRQVKVERVEEFGGNGGWQKFGCYVLVERFVLKRMDGSLVLTHDFKHTHQIKSKWD